MRKYTLRQYVFMALCCDLGLFSKRLLAPVTNLITDALHIPGGIGTSFSIMFVLIGAIVCGKVGCATMMCMIQSGLALCMGMVGSMGILSPIGYILPGIMMDIMLLICKKMGVPSDIKLMFTNALGAITASLTANLIVFHLWGPPLWLYLMVALSTGAVCGLLGNAVVKKLLPAINIIETTGGEIKDE